MWGRTKDILGPFLPDPRDKSDAPLRPTKRDPGVYRFTKGPHEDVVHIEEPSGNTYELVFFDFEKYLKRVLKLSDDTQIQVTDRLWNFYAVEIAIVSGSLQVPVRTFDPAAEKLRGEA